MAIVPHSPASHFVIPENVREALGGILGNQLRAFSPVEGGECLPVRPMKEMCGRCAGQRRHDHAGPRPPVSEAGMVDPLGVAEISRG